MRLHFSGAPVIAAPRDQVWGFLLDPQFIAAATPGVEDIQVRDATHFRVVVGFGVAMFKLHFDRDVELYDLQEPDSARMRMHGKAGSSIMDTRSDIRLEELDSRRVRLYWKAESEVHGAIASVGARLLEGAVRRMTEQFWQEFVRRAERAARASP
jgi:carbon monoxide dehydrogenase subunit G